MAVYVTNDTDLTKVANAIRTKGETSAKLAFPDGFASAVSAITTGITPTGTKEITENGTYDVTNFASAKVEVPTGGGADNYHVIPITLNGLGGTANAITTVISNNAFVKEHYADEAFWVMLMPLNVTFTNVAASSTFLFATNRALAKGKGDVYTIRTIGQIDTSSYVSFQGGTAKVSGSGYNISLRATSAGNITIYTAAKMYVPAGNYLLVMGLAE